MKYDVDYFIKKFSAIPDSRWTVGAYRKGYRRCALGHCGATAVSKFSQEVRALLSVLPLVLSVNDGDPRFRQKTPRARILAALREVKRNAK